MASVFVFTVASVSPGRKGGELASAVHAYTKTGDPSMRSLVQHILSLVSHPVLSFLYRWIYDGELEDTHHEFFVASDPTVKTDRLWHDKYTLRTSMIPSFMTMDQSRKVGSRGSGVRVCLPLRTRPVCSETRLVAF